MTQTQINSCSGSEPPLAMLTQDERSVFAKQSRCCVGAAQSYFQAMKLFVCVNVEVFL